MNMVDKTSRISAYLFIVFTVKAIVIENSNNAS